MYPEASKIFPRALYRT